ncbi:hypothetical protein GCM10023160_21630 [Brachybacterium paraconglomeratum]|uniref:hypothetical protein n=1 Tax=Brachybacterium paraconglomeratum TaxID=173362 RepID=UPI0031E9E644
MTDEQQAQQRERELVLSEYGTWRVTADEDAPAVDEVRTLETLLRLKADRLDSSNPGHWTESLVIALLTEVVPRTVIQPREQVMDMVPTLTRFFTYLRETGRWDSESMSASAAPAVLTELEFATLEAADDPTRRSFSTNILGYGMHLGIDLEDERELAAYMHWYNSLADQERVALSETGRLADPARPYDRGAALRAVAEEAHDPAPAGWPWFLPEPSTSREALMSLDLEQDPEVYAGNSFVRCTVALLEFVGQGRRITATGALGRADTGELLARCGIEQDVRGVRSMWDHPELVGPWVTLRDGGWLEVRAGRVHRERGPIPFVAAAQDPAGFVEFGHAVLTALLLGRDAREVEDGGFRGMPDTLAALMIACREGGLEMRDLRSADPEVLEDRDEVARWMGVRHDLESLVALGALREDQGRFTGSGALLVAVVALLRD